MLLLILASDRFVWVVDLSNLERIPMSLFLTSITSIIPIIAIIVLGYILQVKGWFGDAFGPNLSRLIMNVALPASIFVSVMKYLTLDKLISLSGGLLYTFVAFISGYIVAYIAVVVFKVRPGRRGTMINTFVECQYYFYWFTFKRCSFLGIRLFLIS